jgi:hypothetical protein
MSEFLHVLVLLNEVTREITKLMKETPRREAIFIDI